MKKVMLAAVFLAGFTYSSAQQTPAVDPKEK